MRGAVGDTRVRRAGAGAVGNAGGAARRGERAQQQRRDTRRDGGSNRARASHGPCGQHMDGGRSGGRGAVRADEI